MTMRLRRFAFSFLLPITFLSCSGSSSPGSPAVFGCDRAVGGAHTCIDYSCDVGENACTQAGGTVLPKCASAQSGGGCTSAISSNHATPSTMCLQTVWYYNISAEQVMAICVGTASSFVAPAQLDGGGDLTDNDAMGP
jgi:hypothetical protein